MRSVSVPILPWLKSIGSRARMSSLGDGVETRHAWKPSASMNAAPEDDRVQAHQEVKNERGAKEVVISEISRILTKLNLKPGHDCVLHDGLITVDLAFHHEPSGSNLAILIKPEPTSDPQARRLFAEIKAKTSVLKSIGWCPAVVASGSWSKLRDINEKTHSLVDTLNEALTEGKKQHEHHEGCGCAH